LGYTPLRAVISEILADLGWNWEHKLDFDDWVQLIKIIRYRDGFRTAELEEFARLFNQYDVDDSDTIDCHELRKTLKYLGHKTSLIEVRGLLKAVDENGDGVLNFEEILRLLRLHRERQLQAAQLAFSEDRSLSAKDRIASRDVKGALLKLGFKPTNVILERIMLAVGSPSSLSFDEFVEVLDHSRLACAVENRKRAEWSDREFEFLCQKFHKINGDAEGNVTKGQFLWILIDLGIKITTSQERNDLLAKVEEARKSARAAGLSEKEAGTTGSSTMNVWILAHLLRIMAQGSEDQEEDREIEAREETKFSHAEVAEFGEIFTRLLEEGHISEAAELDETGTAEPRRSSFPALQEPHQEEPHHQERPKTAANGVPRPACLQPGVSPLMRSVLGSTSECPRLSVCALRELLSTFGVRLSLEEYTKLRTKVVEISHGQGKMDFSDFLRVMRWMLDTNFADMNGRAKEVVDKANKSLKKTRSVVNAVNFGLQLSKMKTFKNAFSKSKTGPGLKLAVK